MFFFGWPCFETSLFTHLPPSLPHFGRIGNNMTVSQAGEDVGAAAAAAGAGSKLTVAAGALGTSGAAIVDGRGEDDKVSVSSNAPPSPKREARNPLLSSFTPSPSRQRHKALAGVFASTGGSQ